MAYESKSDAERAFLYYWQMLSKLELAPVSEYRFDDARMWRFDFAWVKAKVAVEIDGGLYMKGRHVSPEGFQKDCYKINRAVELGWRVLRYSPQMLKNDPVTVVAQIEKVLKGNK